MSSRAKCIDEGAASIDDGAASIDEPQGFSGSPPVVFIMYWKCVIILANKDVLFCSVLTD